MEPDQITAPAEVSAVPKQAGAPWLPEERKLLGTMPDREVARALNRTEKAVRCTRQKLRILAYQTPFHRWTPEEEQLLGTLPDAEVAARTGHPLSGVIQRRLSLHICLPRPGHQPWTTAEDKLLGTMKDRELAQRLGRSEEVVKKRRRLLSIPHYYPDYRRLWLPAEEQLLGTMTDERLARRLKRSVETVRTRRAHKGIPVFFPKKHWWTADDDKLLRLRPDAQVAMLLGIGLSAVRHRRNQLRISLPGQPRKVTPPKPWPAEEIAMLGKSPDAQVARRLGRSITSVKTRRLRLGIASSHHRWAPEQDALLGKFPDWTLARRLGCTVKTVQARRAKLGVPAPRPE